ncbi:alpha-glucosidase [Jiangella aurantiaca]|uniref:Alpha-glucosidase n=1 Tax=Jiangella aurantiaca TaxID=2530373 RepID=A0A4R5AC14_9ACTN|nr:alpha-glucosidase [Jiangella aurantiaca]
MIYQVYVRSFADSNGDGIGDLKGVTGRLPYLADLGVDGIWLTPCYPSPQYDHGYDIENHTDIDPAYGDLDDFDQLVAEAHRLGLRVLLDVVPNHCAITHPWFVEALAAEPGNPARERFHFADGDGDAPPNGWRSMFGGPAWTRVPGTSQWYLHLFTPGQPDCNWRHPDVPEMFAKVLRFWLDRGVDGFRIDAAQGLFKHPELADGDEPGADELTRDAANPNAWNQPEVHEVYRGWRAIVDEYAHSDLGDRVLVGEVTGLAQAHLADYVRADEMHQAFLFDLLHVPFEAGEYRRAIDRGLALAAQTGSAPTWVLGNHDTTRVVTRYGGASLGAERARAAFLLLAALPGAVYVYQGDELGLPEYIDLPDEHRADPIFRRTGGRQLGRDGCRIPLPWTSEGTSYGFSPDGAQAPWLPQPPWFAAYEADSQQADSASTLRLYRDLLRLRRDLELGLDTPLTWLDQPPHVLTFARGDLVCLVNTGPDPVPAPDGDLIVASRPWTSAAVPPNSGGWWRMTRSRPRPARLRR